MPVPKALMMPNSPEDQAIDGFDDGAIDPETANIIAAKGGKEAQTTPTQNNLFDQSHPEPTPTDSNVEYDSPESGVLNPPDESAAATPSEPPAPEGQGSETTTVEPTDRVEPTAAEGTTNEGVEFPPELLQRSNLTADEAKAQFGTPEALQKAQEYADQQFINRMIESGRSTQQPAQPPAQPDPQQAPESVQTEQQQPVNQPEFVPMEVPENASEEVEEMINAMNTANKATFDAMTASYQQQIETVNNQFTAQQQAQQQAEEQRVLAEIQSGISEMGDSWKSIFGDRPFSELQPGTPHYENAERCLATVEALSNGLRNSGQSMSLKEIAQAAARATFPEQSEAAVKQDLANKVAPRQNQFISRPAPRKTEELSGREKAMARWDEAAESFGLPKAAVQEPTVL